MRYNKENNAAAALMFDTQLQKTANMIMEKPGNTKGLTFRTAQKYIVRRRGKDGLAQVENKMDKLGYEFHFSNIDDYSWYPEGYAVLAIYLTRPLFGWDEKDMYDMGYSAASVSLILKVAASFVSLRRTFRQAPKLWEKHYDFGSLKSISLDEKNNRLVVEQHEYGYPYMANYFRGYFTKLVELLTGAGEVTVTHAECEDDHEVVCHEFTAVWQ